jgi:hypothetical protein
VAEPGAPQPDVAFFRPGDAPQAEREETEAEEAQRVLARLKEMSGPKPSEDDDLGQ